MNPKIAIAIGAAIGATAMLVRRHNQNKVEAEESVTIDLDSIAAEHGFVRVTEDEK